MYVPAQRRQRRGLGRLGATMPLSLATVTYNPVDTSGCVWDYTWLGKSAFDACVTAAGQNQIATVPANAAAYGYPPNVVAVAQQVAAQQAAQVPADVQNVDTFYNLPSSPFIPSFGPGNNFSDPSTWPTWLWIAIALGGGLFVVSALK